MKELTSDEQIIKFVASDPSFVVTFNSLTVSPIDYLLQYTVTLPLYISTFLQGHHSVWRIRLATPDETLPFTWDPSLAHAQTPRSQTPGGFNSHNTGTPR